MSGSPFKDIGGPGGRIELRDGQHMSIENIIQHSLEPDTLVAGKISPG